MILCFGCRRVSSSGSRYCDGCGLGLGVRICEDGGHTNALSAQVCRVCGSGDLSDGTRAVSLLLLCRLIVILLGIAAWKYFLAPNAGLLLGVSVKGILSTAAFLTNTTATQLAGALQAAVAFLLALWLLGVSLYPLPEQGGSLGRTLRGMPLSILRFIVLSALPRILRTMWGGVVHLLFAPTRKASDTDAVPYYRWGDSDTTYRGRGGWRQ